MSNPEEYRETTIQEYICHIATRWRTITSLTLVAAAVAGLYSILVAGQVYVARGAIIATGELSTVPIGLEKLLPGASLEVLPVAVRPEADMCTAILKSRTVRQQLVRRHKLGRIWGITSEEAAVKVLQEKTHIEVGQPNVVEIEVRLSGAPRVLAGGARNERIRQLSARLVNSYVQALQDKLATLHLSAAKRKRVFLEKKKSQSLMQLKQAEESLQRWESENKLINAQQAGKLATEELVALQQKRVQAQLELEAIAEEIAKAKQLLDEQPQLQIASLEQEANPLIIQLRERLVQLEADLATAVEIKGETEFHPEVEELHQQIEATQQALAQQQQQQMFIARKVETRNPATTALLEQLLPLQIKRQALAAKQDGLKRAIDEAERGIIGLSAQAMEYGRLLREISVREAVYQAVVSEYEQALIAEQAEEPQVYVLDEAVPPERASAPRVSLNMGLAGFAAMIVGLLWALSQGELPNIKLASSAPREVKEDQPQGK